MLFGTRFWRTTWSSSWDEGLHRLCKLILTNPFVLPFLPFYALLIFSRSSGPPLRRTDLLFRPHRPLDSLVQASKLCLNWATKDSAKLRAGIRRMPFMTAHGAKLLNLISLVSVATDLSSSGTCVQAKNLCDIGRSIKLRSIRSTGTFTYVITSLYNPSTTF